MEQDEMTIREALDVTKKILEGISVPVALMDQIGAPLRAAAGNLAVIIEGIDKAEGEQSDGAGDGISV